MAITYHAGRRIQGIAGVDVADSFTSSTDAHSAALSLGGGSGSGNTKIGFEVQTGHFLVNKGLKTLTFALDRYNPVSGNGYVAVYNSSGTQKGDNSSTYNLANLTQYPSPVDYTFTWTTPIIIDNGDRIVLEGGTFSTTAQVDLWARNVSASEQYVNGVYFNSGWTSSSTVDVHFDVTTETNNGDTKPANVQVGSRWEETDTRKMYYRMDSDYVTDKWFELGTLPYAGGRGVFAGGYTGSGIDSMDYITIATTGTVTDFGNLTSARYGIGSLANTLRGVFAGGQSGSTVMDFITPATVANATTFGTLNRTQSYGMMGGASETTGVFAGGETSMTTEITKITIDSGAVQNANFGNLTTARKQGANFSDGTTAFFAGGEEGGAYGVTIDYITIANGGTATDFGDLDLGAASMGNGNISNGTVGMFSLGGGSSNYTTRVDKVTMGTSGTSSSFGTLQVGRSGCSQCSTETRAVFAGGKTANGANYTNTIDYMSFTNGTSSDFGDLSAASQAGAGVSDTGAVRP